MYILLIQASKSLFRVAHHESDMKLTQASNSEAQFFKIIKILIEYNDLHIQTIPTM